MKDLLIITGGVLVVLTILGLIAIGSWHMIQEGDEQSRKRQCFDEFIIKDKSSEHLIHYNDCLKIAGAKTDER